MTNSERIILTLPITPSESVNMRQKVIDGTTPEDTGRFSLSSWNQGMAMKQSVVGDEISILPSTEKTRPWHSTIGVWPAGSDRQVIEPELGFKC